MQHLTADRLAALGDEEPTPLEATHLEACRHCCSERAASQALVAMARAEREPLGLPLTRWDAIAGALAAEGAAQAPAFPLRGGTARRGERAGRGVRWPLQAAAALLLTAGGVMAGRASAGAALLPVPIAASQTPGAEGAAVATGAALAADTMSDGASSFGSVEAAREAQLRSEAIYQQAAAYLAQHDTTGAGDGSPVAYRSRLAALDQVITTTREALRQAPHDPVINGYYLTTLGQREATIRQLNTVLPASLRANSF